MSAEVVVRPLARPDLPVVAALVAGSFDADLTPFMVATQHGWSQFVTVQLDHPEQFRAQRLRVAEVAGRVVGFADFRAPGDGTGFLSYVCVDPATRGRGVARALLRACVREAGELTSVALDVFEDNAAARAMYDSMGFRAGATQSWWRAPLQARAGDLAPAYLALSGLTTSLATLTTYGFCELTGSWAGRDLRCGRLGRSVLRLFAAQDLDDDALLGALAAEFGELTTAFAVLPDGHRPASAQAAEFNRSVRMTTEDLPTLMGVA